MTAATPLWIAASESHKGVVEELIKAGADVDKATTDDGTTPLHIAASEGHKEVVEELIKVVASCGQSHDR